MNNMKKTLGQTEKEGFDGEIIDKDLLTEPLGKKLSFRIYH